MNLNQFLKKVPLPSTQGYISNSAEDYKTIWIRRHGIDLLIGLVLALLLTVLFPTGKSFLLSDLYEGRVYVGDEIIAPFTFAVNKSEEEYAGDIKKAKDQVAKVFKFDETISIRQIQLLDIFLKNLADLLKKPETTKDNILYLFRSSGVLASDADVLLLLGAYEENNNNSNLLPQRRLENFKKMSEIIQNSVKSAFSEGIFNINKSEWVFAVNKVAIYKEQQEIIGDLSYSPDLRESKNQLLVKLRTFSSINGDEIKIIYKIASFFIVPNIFYDQQETESRIETAISSVPLVKDQVLAGERIIESHERITRQHIDRLNSLALAKAEYRETTGWSRLFTFVGKYCFSALLLFILVILIYRTRKEIFDHRRQILLIAMVIYLIILITYLFDNFNISLYLVPVSLAAIIITIFFDGQIGIFTVLIISFLLGAMRGNQYNITFISFCVSSMAVLSVSRVRNRNWIMRSMVLIICSYLVTIAICSFIDNVSAREMLRDWGFAMLNGLLSPIISLGLIIILEFIFDMTTDMTLLELSDLNRPLLRQLAINAPGTYHHSIMVGNLAEAATEAVSGNALLARVGAYYHDIGKLEKPEYFVENQTKGRNPQEKLTPSMSSLILLNHVRKGAEMAKQYGLPKEIEVFIQQHHGTALMSFFYQKAIEQKTGEQISENDFRYPGPKPKTKETAVVMLSDAVEAASRTLKEPSPSRIRGLVEQIIDERFRAGELDESPLTLQDLSKISEAFQNILNGIFHGRILYPVSV